MSTFLFPNDYQKSRAIMATAFNAALLVRGDVEDRTLDQIASAAIDSAEALLNQLGVVDPDTVTVDRN